MKKIQTEKARGYCYLIVLLLAIFLVSHKSWGHEIRPAVLVIKEIKTATYQITLKVPALGDRVIKIIPVFPDNYKELGPLQPRKLPGSYIEHLTITSTDGSELFGQEIYMEGLSGLQIDMLVQLEFLDGTYISGIVQPKAPFFNIPQRGSKAQVAGSYFNMGILHILGGIDHLLFVLALMLIVPNLWTLFKTITAFTVAHSITLALASLGIIQMPTAPTEAVIALSIVFLCIEILNSKKGRKSITLQHPWIVALIFGLFHGLGFAGALSDIGLPPHEIPLALLMFNVGVEAGQVLFVGIILILTYGIGKLQLKWPNWAWKLMPYGIGSLAAFWVVQRTISFL